MVRQLRTQGARPVIVAAARLAPIGRLLDRGDVLDHFDDFTFAHQIGQLENVPVLLDHDRTRQVGDVTRLWRQDGWWWAELQIDAHKHRLGCLGVDRLRANPRHPVSLGADVHYERQAGLLEGSCSIRLATLTEVSCTGTLPTVTPRSSSSSRSTARIRGVTQPPRARPGNTSTSTTAPPRTRCEGNPRPPQRRHRAQDPMRNPSLSEQPRAPRRSARSLPALAGKATIRRDSSGCG